MLTPVEPLIDISNELSLSLPMNFSGRKSKSQGEFGDIFIDNINDYYRPYRRAPPVFSTNSLSSLERRYRLCTNLLDQPPSLPSPPLVLTSSEKLSELISEKNDLRDDESIISTSTLADNEDLINDIQTENIQLLKTLSSTYDSNLRPLSPVFISNDNQLSTTNLPSSDNELQKNEQSLVDGTEKVNKLD